jgi:hypothetical protein
MPLLSFVVVRSRSRPHVFRQVVRSEVTVMPDDFALYLPIVASIIVEPIDSKQI